MESFAADRTGPEWRYLEVNLTGGPGDQLIDTIHLKLYPSTSSGSYSVPSARKVIASHLMGLIG